MIVCRGGTSPIVGRTKYLSGAVVLTLKAKVSVLDKFSNKRDEELSLPASTGKATPSSGISRRGCDRSTPPRRGDKERVRFLFFRSWLLFNFGSALLEFLLKKLALLWPLTAAGAAVVVESEAVPHSAAEEP